MSFSLQLQVYAMPNGSDYTSFFDGDHEEQPKYWGRKAAGCIFLAKDTGRILLAHRSSQVDFEPETWGTWGGKLDGEETPKEAVSREVEEETGYTGIKKIHLLYVYKDGDFEYHNYLVIVPFEFTPQLNWENDNSVWADYGKWPEPLHFGMQELIAHAGSKLKHIIGLLKKRKDDMLNESSIEDREQNFNRWFGNSVVKDSSGKPIVVYHGTNQPVNSFSKTRRGMATNASSAKKAYFFTDSSEVAEKYARSAGGVIRHNIAAYEKKAKAMKNEVDRLERIAHSTGKWEAYEKAMEEWEKFELDTMREDDTLGQSIVPVYLRLENPLVHDFQHSMQGVGGIDNLVKTAIKNGNDGVIFKNLIDPEPSSNHYAVFKPSQIKSATGNNGDFNPNKADITKEAMDVPPAIVQPSGASIAPSNNMTNAYLVAATVWMEARGEGEKGMHAVLNVIMNRAHHDFSKAKDVVLKDKQFAVWNEVSNPIQAAMDLAARQRANTEADADQYKIALKLVDMAMHKKLPDVTHHALFYINADQANPSWLSDVVQTVKIGHHTFYKPKSKVKEAVVALPPVIIKPEGLVDDGVYGYKMSSPQSFISYGYEPTRKLFHLYMVQTPDISNRRQGYANDLMNGFFAMIKQKGGTLQVDSYTSSGTAYIQPMVQRLSTEYGVPLI